MNVLVHIQVALWVRLRITFNPAWLPIAGTDNKSSCIDYIYLCSDT